MTRCLTLTATVVLSLSCGPPVLAQELPNEGKFSITYTAVNPAPSKAVSVGDRDITVELHHDRRQRCRQRSSAQYGRSL
jgi:hypothetical protein